MVQRSSRGKWVVIAILAFATLVAAGRALLNRMADPDTSPATTQPEQL